jgi:hypothetical protein
MPFSAARNALGWAAFASCDCVFVFSLYTLGRRGESE